MRELQIKAILSTVMFLTFIIVAITGLILLNAPNGRIAKETNWNVVGLDKHTVETIHTFSGILFTVLAVFHLYLNHKMFYAELKTITLKVKK
jgi:hypothetical protein